MEDRNDDLGVTSAQRAVQIFNCDRKLDAVRQGAGLLDQLDGAPRPLLDLGRDRARAEIRHLGKQAAQLEIPRFRRDQHYVGAEYQEVSREAGDWLQRQDSYRGGTPHLWHKGVREYRSRSRSLPTVAK